VACPSHVGALSVNSALAGPELAFAVTVVTPATAAAVRATQAAAPMMVCLDMKSPVRIESERHRTQHKCIDSTVGKKVTHNRPEEHPLHSHTGKVREEHGVCYEQLTCRSERQVHRIRE
jgi:hypothetical protein